MRTKTFIKADLSLIFDNQTDTAYVKEQIGLSFAENKDKRNTRRSPFKDDNLPGYWSIITEPMETYDLEDVTENLLDIINPYLEKIKSVLNSFNGQAKFMCVIEMIDNTPSLSFNRKFLDEVEYAELVGIEYYRG